MKNSNIYIYTYIYNKTKKRDRKILINQFARIVHTSGPRGKNEKTKKMKKQYWKIIVKNCSHFLTWDQKSQKKYSKSKIKNNSQK